jgi:hypothetical protein
MGREFSRCLETWHVKCGKVEIKENEITVMQAETKRAWCFSYLSNFKRPRKLL